MRSESRRKRIESISPGQRFSLLFLCGVFLDRRRREKGVCGYGRAGKALYTREKRTKDELLCRCQHVQREGDFVLVSLALEPAQHGGWVQHCGEKKGGG